MTSAPRGLRGVACFVLVSVAAFVALVGAAMTAYPGGTWLDRGAVGHDFFRNFFCDLTAGRALNGQLNPGAPLATAGMLVASVSLAPFWWLVASRCEPRVRIARAVRALGAASSAAAIAIPLAPSQRFGSLHAALIFVAGVPGLAAAVVATVGLASRGREARGLFALAGLTLGLAAVDGALYAAHVISGHALRSPLLPTLQKLAAAALVAWMIATSATAVLRAGRGGVSRRSAASRGQETP